MVLGTATALVLDLTNQGAHLSSPHCSLQSRCKHPNVKIMKMFAAAEIKAVPGVGAQFVCGTRHMHTHRVHSKCQSIAASNSVIFRTGMFSDGTHCKYVPSDLRQCSQVICFPMVPSIQNENILPAQTSVCTAYRVCSLLYTMFNIGYIAGCYRVFGVYSVQYRVFSVCSVRYRVFRV